MKKSKWHFSKTTIPITNIDKWSASYSGFDFNFKNHKHFTETIVAFDVKSGYIHYMFNKHHEEEGIEIYVTYE